jgi:phage tail-like protein
MARQDPLRNFRYRLEIDSLTIAGFSEVVIGETTVEVIEYREGTDPPHARKLSGLTKYGNVTLKRGMTTSLELYQWHKQVEDGKVSKARKKVVIVVGDETGADKARFVVTEAWPTKYSASGLDAQGNEVLIETLELVNEGIERVA